MELFFSFEKEKLRDIVIKKVIDYNKSFNEGETEALFDSLKYSSPHYLDSGIRYFPSYEKARRVEITLYLEKFDEVKELISKVNKILLGRYEILIDFWMFSSSDTKEVLELQYPRLVYKFFFVNYK